MYDPLENWMQGKPNCERIDVENPYIKYQHCQKWRFFSIPPSKKLFHIWSWKTQAPSRSLIPHLSILFYRIQSNRSSKHCVTIVLSAILNKSVYWVGEIKYCTITHVYGRWRKTLDMLITRFDYWKWRGNFRVCFFFSEHQKI